VTDVDPTFIAFLQSEESTSYNGTLLQEVEAAIDSYNGAAYGDEEEGRSQVVARDVAETADYMLTSIMDVMVASGRIVELEPTSEEDEALADDATEAMHYIYRRKSGYRLIHDWAKAGLLEKIGIVKCCVERRKKRVEALYHTAFLPQNSIAAEPTDQIHPADGSAMIHAVTLEETAAQFLDYHVPLEEFRVSRDARDFDNAIYLAHITQKSLSDLVEMGFEIDGIPLSEGSNPFMTSLATARDDGRPSWIGIDDRIGANRKVWLNEEYVLYDLDGDGISERLCVHRVGNAVLNIETVDYQPFEFWCPYPMQGRLIGQSLADKTMDIQRVNTVLERSMLDSLYAQLRPGTFVHEDSCGDHTIDDLLTIAPNRIVRFTGNMQPIPETRTDVSAVAIEAIEFKTKQRESRTGITALNKGVDENTLNETASGQAMLMARGQQMERYIVRNFAEGVSRLFQKKIGLMRQYGQPFQIRVDGEFRTVDPSQWPEDLEANIVVGLGNGSKQQRIQFRNLIAQSHTQLMVAGAPICSWDNVFNNLTAAARDMGFAPNDIYTPVPKDPQGNPVQQQQPPDPKAIAAQQQAQIAAEKLQQQAQTDQQKLQLQAQQQAAEAELKDRAQQAQTALALRQQDMQAVQNEQKLAVMSEKHASDNETRISIAKMKPGGALDE